MNMTKKGKLVTFITVAVICISIVATACLIFMPKKQSEDVGLTSTAYPYLAYESGGYGMEKDTTHDMAWVLAKHDDNDHAWVTFPTSIYVDTSEDLKDLNYYYQYHFHYGDSNNGDYHQYLLHSAMGFYPETGHAWNWENGGNSGTVGGHNDNISTITNANGSMRKFFPNYSIQTPTVPNGSNSGQNVTRLYRWSKNDKDYVSDNAEKEKNTGNYGDDKEHYASKMQGAKYNDQGEGIVEAKMKGSGGATGSYDFIRFQGTKNSDGTVNIPAAPIFITKKWMGTIFSGTQYQFGVNSFTDVETAKKYGTKPVGYNEKAVTDEIRIHIEIYDKSGLLAAMQKLEKQYNAVANRIPDDDDSFNDLKDKVKKLLAERKTTQTAIDSLKEEVESYVFTLATTSRPTTASSTNPIKEVYSGEAFTLESLWEEYSQKLNDNGDYLSQYFNTPVIKYGLSTFGEGNNADGQNMIKAGYYTVAITP